MLLSPKPIVKSSSRILIVAAGLAYIVLVALADYRTGTEISMTALYLPAIYFLSWHLGRPSGIAAAFLSSGLWFYGDTLSGHVYAHPLIAHWNLAILLTVFLAFTFLFTALRLTLDRQQHQLQALTRSSEEIRRLSNVKTQFINTVSHELRTPLTVIKESIAIVHKGEAGQISTEQEYYLAVARRNVDRLARLITDVLDFQQFEAGRMTLHCVQTDINALVNEAVEGFASLAMSKGLQLSVSLDKGLTSIFMDADKIAQVLANFIGNAVKFSERGTITIMTRRKEDMVRVSVEDQGIGIRNEDFLKLFLPFGQLEDGYARKVNSTGLGLAISKEIIEAHDGTIGVESVHGKGAIFHFDLPLNRDRSLVNQDRKG